MRWCRARPCGHGGTAEDGKCVHSAGLPSRTALWRFGRASVCAHVSRRDGTSPKSNSGRGRQRATIKHGPFQIAELPLYLFRAADHRDRASSVWNIAPVKLELEVAEVQNRRRAMIEHRPFQVAELRFPPLRPPRLGVSRGPAPWTKRGKRAALEPVPADGVRNPWPSSAVNIAPINGVERHPKLIPGCQATPETDPLATRKPTPPLDQWHGTDGVIHALSMATIPGQSSRGGKKGG